jgi:hypothetical protein
MNFRFAVVSLAAAGGAVVASPFATEVISYDAGSNASPSYADASNALGAASRMTGAGGFISGVTPFNPAFATDQLVSVGSGGSLTLGFDRDITDGPSHRFGVDLIVFSNAFFVDQSYFDADPTNDGAGVLGPNPSIFGSDGVADVYVSADGVDWRLAATTSLNLFPTLGYSDFESATPTGPGVVPTDFTSAMNPSLSLADLADMDFAQLAALYGTSAGGVGIDISQTGLDLARFVRIENNSASAFSVDAVSVVPAPSGICLLAGLGALARRRRA